MFWDIYVFSFLPRLTWKNFTYSIIQVLGQRVNEDDLARGSGSIQTDGGVEVIVPKHGAAQQSHHQSHDQHWEQGDDPAQDRYTCGAGQISNVTTAWERLNGSAHSVWKKKKRDWQKHKPSAGYDSHETFTYLHCPVVQLSWPDTEKLPWPPCSWGWCQREQGKPPPRPPTGQKIPCCHDDTLMNQPASLTLPGTSGLPGCCRLRMGSDFAWHNKTVLHLPSMISALSRSAGRNTKMSSH